jgi:hypothetical protein
MSKKWGGDNEDGEVRPRSKRRKPAPRKKPQWNKPSQGAGRNKKKMKAPPQNDNWYDEDYTLEEELDEDIEDGDDADDVDLEDDPDFEDSEFPEADLDSDR